MAASEVNIDTYAVWQNGIGNFGGEGQSRQEGDNREDFDRLDQY